MAVGSKNPWDAIKQKLETEGAKNKTYDSDVDGVFDVAAIPALDASQITSGVLDTSRISPLNADLDFAGHYMKNYGLDKTKLSNLAYGKTVSTGGSWNTAPSNPDNLVDGDESTDTGVGTTTGDANCVAYCTIDLGAVYGALLIEGVTAMTRRDWTAGLYLAVSADDTTYYLIANRLIQKRVYLDGSSADWDKFYKFRWQALIGTPTRYIRVGIQNHSSGYVRWKGYEVYAFAPPVVCLSRVKE